MIRAALLPLLLAGCAAQTTGASRFVGAGGPVGDYRLPVVSVAEQRFTGIVHQRYDFSCGSAALATLLRYHYSLAVGEDDVFRGMWAHGDRAQIRRLGFSLLDMKRWLASRGLAADGYKVSLDQIATTRVPGVALIAIKNYRHFVVVKGVRGDEVLLGDPSAGITVVPREQFLHAWNGIYFVLAAHDAHPVFNSGAHWAAFARAPLGDRFADPVSQQALSLTAPFYGDF